MISLRLSLPSLQPTGHVHALIGRCRGGGHGGHVALVAGGGRPGHRQVAVGGREVHVDDGHHVVLLLQPAGLGLLGLGGSSSLGLLDSLQNGRRGLLALDEERLDLPLGGGGGDDEAEPDGEDDAEGDGGGREPPGDPHLGVETGDPVRPAPAQ